MNIPDPIKLTQDLICFNTINPPGTEDELCNYLTELLKSAQFECMNVDFAPRRRSVVARIQGTPGKSNICFTGHVDVVPLGDRQWDYDPFAGEIHDGKLFGRGSSDMKSGIAAFVVAAMRTAELSKNGNGVSLIITAGEETGCEGAFYIAAQKQVIDFIGNVGCFIVAEPTANEPIIGHKGAFWLRAKAEGITAHGSMPERGDNAFFKIAKGALLMEKFQFDTPPHDLMGQGTMNVGTAKAGLNINSVPDAAEMTLDIRTVPGQSHKHIYGCLCKVLGPNIKLETIMDVEGIYTPPDHPWIKTVFAQCQEINGLKASPKSVSYFSDASALKGLIGDPPTVVLGPGQPEMAHQTNEFCYSEKINQCTILFERLIIDWHNH